MAHGESAGMTAKLATLDDHILAAFEDAGGMRGESVDPRSATDKSQVGFIKFDSGYLSPYFVTDPERMEVAFDNAYILIHEKHVGSRQDLLPLLEQITKSGKPLVIVAEDVRGEVLATLVVKNLGGPLRVAAVRAPGSGDQRKNLLQGIAIITGGRTITEGPDAELKNIQISDLGQAAKITIDKNCTVIEVKAEYDRRIRMPLYANLSLPPGSRNNATMTADRELAPPEQ
jgi:chaperonin GroEL (HSP60 family)